MQLHRFLIYAAIATLGAALAFGQAQQRTRALGTLSDVRTTGAMLKTDAGAAITLVFGTQTRFQKVAPGEKDLSKAQSITVADVASGDRVLARGIPSDDNKTLVAQSVIVMSASDIASKQEKERAEWARRSVAGLVTATDPAAKQIQIRIPSLMGQAHTMTVVLTDSTRLRRYAPDSVRFADARPSTLAELAPGDQLRALGEKSEDGTRITAEEIISGSFRTVAGKITALDAAAGTVQMQDLDSGAPLTIKVTADSRLRRLPQFGAGPMGGPGGAMRAGAGPGAAPRAAAGSAEGAPAGVRRGPDLQQMLERMPAIALNELKPGETVVVSSTRSANSDHLTAVTLLAGADALLAMRQAAAAQSQGASSGGMNVGTWNLGDMSMIPAQ
ncbi:MAG TPA: hypothetical protein VHA11_02610 [Bryobacteraceae bacterium]|nr:hypothetical protein [Bryobacteraceae bacterium]